MDAEQGADPGVAPQVASRTDARTATVAAMGVLAIAALTAGGMMVSLTVGLFVLGACLAIGAVLLGLEPEPPAKKPIAVQSGQRRSPTF